MIQTEALFDLSYTVLGDFLRNYTYPWEALSHIGQAILAWGEMLDKERYDQPKPGVWIAKTATVAHSACLVAPCIIDEGAEVRHCAFLRGNVLVGKRAVVGNSTELKNAILFDQAQVPHFNYVGDSILGYKAHLGAGAVTSNVKSDKGLVVVGGMETGLKKFGAMVGDVCVLAIAFLCYLPGIHSIRKRSPEGMAMRTFWSFFRKTLLFVVCWFVAIAGCVYIIGLFLRSWRLGLWVSKPNDNEYTAFVDGKKIPVVRYYDDLSDYGARGKYIYQDANGEFYRPPVK